MLLYHYDGFTRSAIAGEMVCLHSRHDAPPSPLLLSKKSVLVLLAPPTPSSLVNNPEKPKVTHSPSVLEDLLGRRGGLTTHLDREAP